MLAPFVDLKLCKLLLLEMLFGQRVVWHGLALMIHLVLYVCFGETIPLKIHYLFLMTQHPINLVEQN